MSTNGDNITEDAEMAECDGDKVVTMMDVLQEQQEFEEDANAVLGASDDKNCTYPKGYIKRQALYACLTCCTEAKEDPARRAGVCLACSLTCHENHELVELYTKRNFRCDCGNPKFNSHPCQFTPTKTDLNEDNIYNQNFSGLYCVCHRPYPDPEATFEDDMIQCIICEDWLHSSHLEATVPSSDQYAEMICKGCMEKNEFLHDYAGFAVNAETDDVDIVAVNGNDSVCNGDLKKLNDSEAANRTNDVTVNSDVEMDVNKAVEHAEPSDNVEAKVSSETTNDKVNDTDIVMTDKVQKIEEKAENTETNETVDNDNGSKVNDKKQEEVSSAETSIAQQENEQTAEIISTVANRPDEMKEDVTPIDVKTHKNNDTSESTDINTTNALDDAGSNNVESDQCIEKPDDKGLEANAELDKAKIASEQSTEQKLEESTTNNEQKIPEAENSTDNNKESSNEVTEASVDKPLAEPATNAEKTEDQQLLDDLNELTSEKDPAETECQQDTNGKDKSETSNAQITKETDENTDGNDNSTKEQSESVETSEVKEPIEAPENKNSSEANETMEIAPEKEEHSKTKEPMETEVPQSTEIIDTSQNILIEKENNDKTDAVMSAIDEILEGSSETKSDTAEETCSTTEETRPKDNNETNTSIDTNKVDDVVNEDNVKSSDDNKVTEDIEMTDENEPQQIENKVENETPISESKLSEAITHKDMNETADDNNITKDSEIIEASDLSVMNNIENSIKETPNSTEAEEKSTEADNAKSTDNENKVLTESTNDNKRKHDTELDDISAKKAKLDGEKSCMRPKNVKRIYKGATFWGSNFRQKLCTCGECISMYKDLNVLFLTDIEDTVTAYESLGKENIGISQYEKGLEALSSLDRIQQINALTEYNKMRDKLLDFLKSFKDRKEIVKEEDIKAFFAGMKPKREPDGVYFCR